MNFKEKIDKILSYSELTVYGLSKKTGINKTMIFNYVNKDGVPSYTSLVQILETFPEISAEWLMRGTGEMLLKEEQSEPVDNIDEIVVQAKKNADAAIKASTIEEKVNEVRIDFYIKDNNRLQIELQELKNKMAKLEERNLLLQNKLLGL